MREVRRAPPAPSRERKALRSEAERALRCGGWGTGEGPPKVGSLACCLTGLSGCLQVRVGLHCFLPGVARLVSLGGGPFRVVLGAMRLAVLGEIRFVSQWHRLQSIEGQ